MDSAPVATFQVHDYLRPKVNIHFTNSNVHDLNDYIYETDFSANHVL